MEIVDKLLMIWALNKLLLCINEKLSFFGKIFRMTEEKDENLVHEPVTQFLPSARYKSGNNMVH